MPKPAERIPTGLTGIVLAGGRSRRLGEPKPLVLVGRRLILARTFDALKRVCNEQILVVRRDQDDAVPDTAIALGMHVVADSFEGMGQLSGPLGGSLGGPLVGIEAGLAAAQTDLAFVVAADHPFLSPELIKAMAERAQAYDTVVARVGDRLQPLHAVYRRSTWLPVVRAALNEQRLSPSALLDDAIATGSPRVLVLDETDLTQWDPGLRSFLDIDTPEDLAQAEQISSHD
jgi:molybdopterin-guanine dinucleotide biosynthesis protein A